MALSTITSSIGTIDRDFSTINLWEADHSNLGAQPYDSSVVDYDDALVPYDGIGNALVGEVFGDSIFDELTTLNDQTPASIRLTVVESERHDGTAGTGARIVRSAGGDIFSVQVDNVTIEGFELDANGFNCDFYGAAKLNTTFSNFVCHGAERGANLDSMISATALTSLDAEAARINNGVLYDIHTTSGGSNSDTSGIRHASGSDSRVFKFFNLTVANIKNDSAGSSGSTAGFIYNNANNSHAENLICVDVGGTHGATPKDFNNTGGGGSLTESHNLSEDATAAGTGSLINKTADQFVSTVIGSENYRLKVGSDGFDVGVTIPEVVDDIIGTARPQFDAYDMGAFESLTDLSAGFLKRGFLRGIQRGILQGVA